MKNNDIRNQKKLRVLIVLSELRAGGMERVVVHLAKGLNRRCIKTMVLCIENPGDLASELTSENIHCVALGSNRSVDIIAAWRLRRLLKEFSPSVINIHDYASAPYVIAANWIGNSAPVVFTAHGLLYQGFDRLRPRYRFFSKWFVDLTAVSGKVAARHKEFLNWHGTTTIIPNGVPAIERNADLRRLVRNELEIGANDIVFLAVGNPRPEKGFEDLIDAAEILKNGKRLNKNFHVVIAGKLTLDDYCRMLQARAKERNVEGCFQFVGFRKDTTALYSAADGFVLSSRSEGLPMVILEAMTAGLPVIATKVGGVPAALDGNGLLVDPGQPKRLAIAMEQMMTENGLMEKIGRAGQGHAREAYGVDRMVDAYIKCYKTVIERENHR